MRVAQSCTIALMLETNLVPETSVNLKQLTLLTDREDFINVTVVALYQCYNCLYIQCLCVEGKGICRTANGVRGNTYHFTWCALSFFPSLFINIK
jgi:hypothetical protein